MTETRLSWEQYATRWADLHGGFDPRRASPATHRWLRLSYGLGRLCGRLGVSPGAVTTVGLLLCLVTPVLARWRFSGWAGGPLLAAGAVMLAALADSVDGATAVVTGRTSRFGYVYDSVADRVGEACWLVAFWVLGGAGPMLVLAGALSWLHEYVRARAGAAGMIGAGAMTVGERPGRVAVTVVGLLVAAACVAVSPDFAAGTVTILVAIWALLALVGLGQLLSAVGQALR